MNPERRLILIGGAAGTGKSTTARALAERLSAGWLQLDTIWIALRDSATPGSPERDTLDIDRHVRARTESPEGLLRRHLAASRAVCAVLPHALAFELQTHPVLVADGAWLLPAWVADLELPGVRVTSAFLHEADLDHLSRAMSSRRDVAMVAPWHADSTRLAWLYGNWLAAEAAAVSLQVLSARPYEKVVEGILAL